MLTIENLSAYYGEVCVLSGVSLTAKQGEITALIGSNASGKTTLASCVSGLHTTYEGEILFEGKSIKGLRSDEIVARGLVQVPEGRLLFPKLTVRENLELGAYGKRSRTGRQERLDHVCDLFPRLRERQKQLAGSLSGGEAQMCAIGRGLMSDPKFLILDEPSLGLAPIAVGDIMRIVEKISAEGVAVLLVEQNVRRSLKIAHRAYVLENGVLKAEGSGAELLASDEIRKAYLGM